KRVLTDTMQISSLASGGPSATVAGSERVFVARCLLFFTLRSLFASLLALRATAYWARVPELAELREACSLLDRCLDDDGSNAARCREDDVPAGPRIPLEIEG
ncbi:MAG: hypothetical protein ACOC1U_09795, partial [Spirochaetota bacterium]